MKLNRIFVLMIMGFSIPFLACGSGPGTGENYEVVSADQFSESISGEEVQLIDVRTADEYNAGYIEGALNYDYLSGEVDLLINELDKSKPVFVYCRSGKRSASSAQILLDAGFEKVIDLKGGFLSWADAGLPVAMD
jgi:rhodanese-related sulfurtransferase